MMKSRLVVVCITAAALIASLMVLGTTERAGALDSTAQLSCEVGELVNDQCVETGDAPTAGAATCPTSDQVIDDATGCYTLIPRPAGECPTGTTPDPDGVSCRVAVEPILELEGAGCPPGFAFGDPPLSDRCVQQVSVLEAAPVCYPNRGQAGACYLTEPLLRDCAEGVLAGEFCVITGAPPVDGGGGQLVCGVGFAPINGDCIRYSSSFVDTVNGPCAQGTLDAFDLCRVSVADRVSEMQCIDPIETLEDADCVVRLPVGENVCVTGFTFTNTSCVLTTDAQQGEDGCPDGARGAANGCYIYVAKGPAGEPFCFEGVLQGSVCVVSFGPPPCESFATDINGDCVAFLSPFTPSPQCPVRSFEIESGDCARPVANAAGPFYCDSPIATLQGTQCVTTTPSASCSEASPPPGFTFDNGECVRVSPATMSNPACTGRTVTINGDCFAVIASTGGQLLTCAEGTVDAVENVCAVAARLVPQDPTLSCPPGYTEDAALGGICARYEAAVSGPACPDGARGEPGACYILVAKGPAPDPECLEGELDGSVCVIIGDPPVEQEPGGPLQCAEDFGIVDGECVRYEDPIQTAAQCPDGSLEDSNGDCRQPVEDITAALTCPDPDSALNGTSCVFTAGFIITLNPPLPVCDSGVLTETADDRVICVFGEPTIELIEQCPIGTELGNLCLVPADPQPNRYCEAPGAGFDGTSCVILADVVCPQIYSLDDALGTVCARFEPADEAQGVFFCPVDGTLNGSACVFTAPYAAHCDPGTGTCGESIVVVRCPNDSTLDGDECFDLILLPLAECPANTTAVSDTACRDEVDLVPGPLSCDDDFTLEGDECLRLSDPTVTYAFVSHGRPTWAADTDRHAVTSNEAGDGVMVAVKANGDLYARRISPAGAAEWRKQGAGGWASANVAIDESGRAEIIGVKEDGRLFTRSWLATGEFGSWTRHGAATWDAGAQPSIATNGSLVMFGAVKSDGRMFTRLQPTAGAWESHVSQGASGWANVDVAVAPTGELWLVAIKTDGRLFTRTGTAGAWQRFQSQGSPTWALDAAPSISTGTGDIIYAALKESGRLYSRSQSAGTGWRQPFVQHGRGGWAGGEVDMNDSGVAAIVAVKESGALYTRVDDSGWGSWTQHGRPTWSVDAHPAVAVSGADARLLGVKASGDLYTRVFE